MLHARVAFCAVPNSLCLGSLVAHELLRRLRNSCTAGQYAGAFRRRVRTLLQLAVYRPVLPAAMRDVLLAASDMLAKVSSNAWNARLAACSGLHGALQLVTAQQRHDHSA